MDDSPLERPPHSSSTPPGPMPPGFPPPPEGHRSPSLYPLNVDRMLQVTFSLFRFRWRTFLAISFAVMVPVTIATALIQVMTVDAIFRWTEALLQAERSGDLSIATSLQLIPWQALAFSWIGSVVLSLVTVIVGAATTHAAGVAIDGGQPSAAASLRAAFRRFPTLAGLFLITVLATLAIALIAGTVVVFLVLALQPGVLVFLGLIIVVALVALLVFITIRWAFAVAIVMLEGVGAMQALRRTWWLVTGSSWRVLGYVLLIAILVGLPVAVISYAVNAVIGSGVTASATTLVVDAGQVFASTIATGLLASLFAPVGTIAMTLLYFDLRFRRGEPVPQPGEAVRQPTEAPPPV